MLNNGDVDTSGFLEEGLVVPVWVDALEFSGNSVMFTSKQGVHTGQDQLFVDTDFTSFETEHALVWTQTTLIGEVQFKWEQILESIFGKYRVHAKETIVAGSQFAVEFLVDTVDGVSVDDTGQRVELGTRAQTAAGSGRWETTDEIDTFDVEEFVEVIVIRNWDFVTVLLDKDII
jgi:hypothetical protein